MALGQAVSASHVSPSEAHGIADCDVFVLAGGLGTRIEPVLDSVPKLLAPVGDRPFLALLLAWLRRHGARRIILGLGHRADAVLDYLRANPPCGMVVETVVEPRPLGTAGALRFARSTLHSNPVLVINGDSFVDADLGAFLAAHRAAGVAGSMLCVEVDDAGRYGRVLLKGDRIDRFMEKDASFHGRAVVNAGCYLLSASLLDDIAAGEAVSLERDVFERLPAGSLGAYAGRFAFIDIGTPESLKIAGEVVGAMRLDPEWGVRA